MESQRSAILRELAQNITNNSNRSVISSTGSDHGTVGSDDTLFSHESNESDFDVSYIQASIGLLDDFFGLAQSQRQPSPGSPSSKPVRKWKAPNDISIVTKRSTRSPSLSTTSNISASSTSSQQLPELPRQPPSERRQPSSPNVSNHYSIADTNASSIGLQPHLKIREELARLRQKARARAASMSDVTTNATASKAPIGRRRASVGSTQLFDTQQISQHISIMRETIEPTNNNTNTLPSSPLYRSLPSLMNENKTTPTLRINLTCRPFLVRANTTILRIHFAQMAPFFMTRKHPAELSATLLGYQRLQNVHRRLQGNLLPKYLSKVSSLHPVTQHS